MRCWRAFGPGNPSRPAEKLKGPEELLDKAQQAASGLAGALGDAAEKVSVRGTFGATADRGLMGGVGAAERTVEWEIRDRLSSRGRENGQQLSEVSPELEGVPGT